MTFELFQSEKNQQYYFRLRDEEGNICLKSEGYSTKAACEKGKRSVERNSEDETKYDVKLSKTKKYYFNLKAGNGQVIGTSPLFTQESICQQQIKKMQFYFAGKE